MLSHPRKQKANTQVVVVPVTPIVVNDNVTTKRNTPITISVLTNDTDYNPATVTIVSQPETGGTAVANADGTITFTPTTDFTGNTSFTYTVRSPAPHNLLSNVAVVGINVTAPAAPVVINHNIYTSYQSVKRIYILNGATDIDNDIAATTTSLVVSTPIHGSVVKGGSGLSGLYVDYTPNNGYSGADTFTYTIKDIENNISNTGTVAITVGAQVVAGAKPEWVTSLTTKYYVKLRWKPTTSLDPLTTMVTIGTDGYFVIDENQPVGKILPPHLTSLIGNTPAGGSTGFTKNIMATVAENLGGSNLANYNALYGTDGVTIELPFGYYKLATGDFTKWQIYHITTTIRLLGPECRFPWFAGPAETCILRIPGADGLPINLRDGSVFRFENIVVEGSPTSTDNIGIACHCKYAARIELVHCGLRHGADGIKLHEEQLENGWGSKPDGRESDTTTTAHGFKNAGLWFYDSVSIYGGINNGASIKHPLYSLNAQLSLEDTAFVDSYYAGKGGGVGNNLIKHYGLFYAKGCLLSTHTRADLGFKNLPGGDRYTGNVYWGQNLDLNAFSPLIGFNECQFVYWQRTDEIGTVTDPSPSTVVGISRRNAMLCENVAVPWYFFRMTGDEQNLHSYRNRIGQWADAIGYPPKPLADRLVRHGIGRFAVNNVVSPGVSSLSVWDKFMSTQSKTPSYVMFDVAAWNPKDTSASNYTPWTSPYTNANFWTISYVTRNTVTGAIGRRQETVTMPTYDSVVFAPGGGPQGNEVIPGGTFVDVWRTDLGKDKRLLNPIYHNPAHPNYYWTRRRALTVPESINSDIIAQRYMFNSYYHYIGPAQGNGGNNVPAWMPVMMQLPSSYGLGSFGQPRLVLPPVWYEGCGWSKPTGAGTFSDLHSEINNKGFVGGTMPTGYSGYEGSDYTEPSNLYVLNVARTKSSGPYDNGTSWDRTWLQMFGVGYVGDSDPQSRDGVGGNVLPWTSPQYSVPRYRFNNNGELKDITDADSWPDSVETTLAQDALVGVTQITVVNSAGITNGMRLAFFISSDRWGITQKGQEWSDAANIRDKSGNRYILEQWRHITTVVGAPSGNVVTFADPIPTFDGGPSVGAWAGVAVVAHKVFNLPPNAPTKFEMCPHAKIDLSTVT